MCVYSSVSFITYIGSCCLNFDQGGKTIWWSGSEGPEETEHTGSERPRGHQGQKAPTSLLQESAPEPSHILMNPPLQVAPCLAGKLPEVSPKIHL